MEGKQFAKLAKDTKLIDKKLTATDVDLIFAKVKAKTERRITFDQFMSGLEHFATKKGVEVAKVHETVGASRGPVLTGTKADAVKFHDDKSLYTGVYAKGGPTNVDKDKVSDISQTCNRGDADVRGIAAGEVAHVTKKMSNVVIEEKKEVKKTASKTAVQSAPAGSLQEVFNKFTAGQKEMDGKTFAKFAKDCKIINKACTTTDIDLIFAKSKDKAARKITYKQFEGAVELCAAKRSQSAEALIESILGAGGPVFAGTKADAVKFHDDKNLYTGVYAKGGPSNVDNDKVADISQTCNRGAADVRGNAK